MIRDVVQKVIDNAELHLVPFNEREHHCAKRKAADEMTGPVYRVAKPETPIIALTAKFFADERNIGIHVREFGSNVFFDIEIQNQRDCAHRAVVSFFLFFLNAAIVWQKASRGSCG